MDSPPRVEDSNLNDSGFGDHPLTISVTRNNPATRTRQDQGKRHREKRRNPVKYINPIYEVTELLHISMNSEQMTGLEPALQPWQGRVLPLTPHLHIPAPPTPARRERSLARAGDTRKQTRSRTSNFHHFPQNQAKGHQCPATSATREQKYRLHDNRLAALPTGRSLH